MVDVETEIVTEDDHVCRFEPALDLITQESWTECRCGRKRIRGGEYHRPVDTMRRPGDSRNG